jgi:hypothetical protein
MVSGTVSELGKVSAYVLRLWGSYQGGSYGEGTRPFSSVLVQLAGNKYQNAAAIRANFFPLTRNASFNLFRMVNESLSFFLASAIPSESFDAERSGW